MNNLASLQGIQAALDTSPFQVQLGLRVAAFDHEAGRVELAMPFRPQLARQHGDDQIHGGVLSALMDVAGDYALGTRLGYTVPTINLHADYLRPAYGDMRAVAETVRCGRTIGVADISVYDGQDQLVAAGRGTYATRRT